jgi:hypothetical protein
MNRREALSSVALLLGGTIIGSSAFLSGCKANPDAAAGVLSAADMSLLNDIAEIIIPTTNTPGAKAAKVGEFMGVIVTDCYDAKDQKVFKDGLAALAFKDAKAKIGKAFNTATPEEQQKMIVDLDAEAKKYQETKTSEQPTHYFTMIKQLTLWGYFSSEIGATQALRYVAIPGKYEGCVPYKKDDKAWAT